jgi:hypothetical protein
MDITFRVLVELDDTARGVRSILKTSTGDLWLACMVKGEDRFLSEWSVSQG